MNKNIVRGKNSESKVMAFIQKKGPSRLAAIGKACKGSKGREIAWAWSVCKRLVAQGLLTKRTENKIVLYDLIVRS